MIYLNPLRPLILLAANTMTKEMKDMGILAANTMAKEMKVMEVRVRVMTG